MTSRATLAFACALPILSGTPALAWYDICNKTSSRVRVAVAFIGSQGYQSEGWWSIHPGGCATVVGDGEADDPHHYWFHAKSDNGTNWTGGSDFCTANRNFEIVGTNCDDRGYDWTSFKHVESSSGNHTTNLRSSGGGQIMD